MIGAYARGEPWPLERLVRRLGAGDHFGESPHPPPRCTDEIVPRTVSAAPEPPSALATTQIRAVESGADHDPAQVSVQCAEVEERSAVAGLARMSLRSRLQLRAVQLRHVVRLREARIVRTVAAMEAHALLQMLMPERARFVRFARLRLASEADAEDLVQRSLARPAERAATLDEPTRAIGWFFRILRRAIVDYRRTGASDPMRRQASTNLELLADDRVAPTSATCACSVRLLEDVRPAYREVVRRIDLDGDDPATVAAELGISLENLHVRLHRARRALRADVERYCGVTSLGACLDCACDRSHRCGESAACASIA